MKFILLVVAVAAVGGMILGLIRSRKGAASGSAIAGVCMIVGLAAALAWAMRDRDDLAAVVVQKERTYQQVSAQKLGAHIAETYPDARVAVILPFELIHEDADRAAIVTGVLEGLGENASNVMRIDGRLPDDVRRAALEAVRLGESSRMPQRNEWYTPAYFDELVEPAMGKCDVLISLIGLPEDAAAPQFWRRPDRPKLAVWYGPVRRLRAPIAAGDVAAAVARRPDAIDDGEPAPDDLDAAFDRRFLLVTPQNVAQVAQQYPSFFLD
jgi:hypothetical protein